MTRRPIKLFMAVAIAGLATVACGEVEPEGSFTVSGTLTDVRKAGLAIPGASIRLEGKTTSSMTTDSVGRFRFADVPGGKFGITIGAPPGYSHPVPIEFTADSDLTMDLTLAHTGIPPFDGTVWVTPDILGPDDPSSFGSVTYTGRGMRQIFDRRADAWITVNAYLFDVQFGERTVEWQFNPEFGSSEAAAVEIEVFAPAIGRLPAALLAGLREVEVNAGEGLFGGSPYTGGILIHTEDSATRFAIDEGFLEEVLMHEVAHASLDMEHREAPAWLAAQEADGAFISDYAEEFPGREDVAESILPYFAIRYRPARLTELQRWHMTMTPPHRWDYFDGLELDMSPYTPQPHVVTVPPETVTPPVVRGGRRFEDPPIPRPKGR